MPKSKSRKKKVPKRVRGVVLFGAAVRRIAYEAADAGLLSPELAAGIRRAHVSDDAGPD